MLRPLLTLLLLPVALLAAERPTVGAIRWDAWSGGGVTSQVEQTLSPEKHRFRLPWFAQVDASGLKGFNVSIWHGMYAPKGTPAPVLKKLNDALKVALKDPEFIKKQEGLGALVVTDKRMTPEGHKAFVAAEITKLKAVIDAAGQFAD